MNYDWHLNTRKNHQRRHDEYLLALSEQNKLKKQSERETLDDETARKQELEAGFSTYVNGAHSAKKRAESRATSRGPSRIGSAKSRGNSPTRNLDEMNEPTAHRNGNCPRNL